MAVSFLTLNAQTKEEKKLLISKSGRLASEELLLSHTRVPKLVLLEVMFHFQIHLFQN